jgi:BirA family biotin operon repressor/biotin-[acetyl-CoA-carboxylase] ligase
MVYTPERLQTALSPRPVRYLPEVGSTNDVALGWLRQGAPAGAVVVADAQVQGRGRLGRRWHAPAGTALIVSVVLKPPRAVLGRLTMVGAVAIAETIEALGAAEVDLKWPNDVRLHGRKVCGILPEAAWEGDDLLGAVLGMGLNVRVDFTGSELADSATSLEPALGRTVDRVDLLARLLERVDDWQTRADSAALFEAWKRRLSTIGQVVTVSGAGVHGIAEGVDDQGALLVRTGRGDVQRVVAGDIQLGE